jgi:hypothetical protein
VPITATANRIEAMSQAEAAECLNIVVTTSSGHFQRCANPFCNAVIEPMNHGRCSGLGGGSIVMVRLRIKASKGAARQSGR